MFCVLSGTARALLVGAVLLPPSHLSSAGEEGGRVPPRENNPLANIPTGRGTRIRRKEVVVWCSAGVLIFSICESEFLVAMVVIVFKST